MLLAFSKSNDSPCFVKIAIFRQQRDRDSNLQKAKREVLTVRAPLSFYLPILSDGYQVIFQNSLVGIGTTRIPVFTGEK